MNRIQPSKNLKFLLLSLSASLITLHLTLTWRSGNANLLSASMVFWVAVACLIWKKHQALNLYSDVSSKLLGISLLILVLFQSTYLFGNDLFLRLSPIGLGLGVGLLASGFKGLKQYWQELVLLCAIAIPWESLLPFTQFLSALSLLTAKFATFVLWSLGFPIHHKGVFMTLPTGTLEVAPGCSGIGIILQLLGWAFILLVMVPTSWRQKVLVLSAAFFFGFVVNGVRVALLAVLVALSNPTAFDYWHQGDGSLIFSMIAVFMFGIFCYFIVLRKEVKKTEVIATDS